MILNRIKTKILLSHPHTASVYVKCRECLMFGIPLPTNLDCGNCNSKDVVVYFPECCIEHVSSLNDTDISELFS